MATKREVTRLTLGERIKKLRKALNLTQQEFANRIGSKRNTVATYEMGRTDPSSAIVSLIHREFSVSEEWLRTGEGEMFIPSPEEDLNELIRQHRLDDLDRQILLEFIKLTDDERAVFKKYLRNLIERSAVQVSDREKTIEQQADEFAARAREQFLTEKRQALQASSANESAGA